MKADKIYDELLEQGIPEKIIFWNNNVDCIDMLIQDYNEKVYKEALKFFKGYKGVDIDYTIDHQTYISYKDVSKFSSDECIRSLTDFYYTLRAKGLAYTESKKSAKESMTESESALKKSNKIIEKSLLDLITNDTIKAEFNDVWNKVKNNGIYDSIDDVFEICVHNILNDLLKKYTVEDIY